MSHEGDISSGEEYPTFYEGVEPDWTEIETVQIPCSPLVGPGGQSLFFFFLFFFFSPFCLSDLHVPELTELSLACIPCGFCRFQRLLHGTFSATFDPHPS